MTCMGMPGWVGHDDGWPDDTCQDLLCLAQGVRASCFMRSSSSSVGRGRIRSLFLFGYLLRCHRSYSYILTNDNNTRQSELSNCACSRPKLQVICHAVACLDNARLLASDSRNVPSTPSFRFPKPTAFFSRFLSRGRCSHLPRRPFSGELHHRSTSSPTNF